MLIYTLLSINTLLLLLLFGDFRKWHFLATPLERKKYHPPVMHPYLDEPPYYLWSVFGQLLHFAVENEWHQDVFFIGFQHDVAHCHGWSGYCLSQKIKNKSMCSDATKNVSIQENYWQQKDCKVPVHKNTVLFQNFWGPCRSCHHSSSNIKSALRRRLRSPCRCPSCPPPKRAGLAWSTLLTNTAAEEHIRGEQVA